MSEDVERAEVRISCGALIGNAQDGVLCFRGVPYATPPLGDRRWRPSETPASWTTPRSAERVGAIAMQRYQERDNGVGPLPMSEDCLTLNVWAPQTRSGPLPVMFWIHGGGLVNGSGTAALYDGSALARQGVLVVTIGYRLGRLGFFAHPALSRAQAGEPLANYGFMDQVAALRWVRENIAQFGGDPGNVTLFGQSAGGVSVQRLMLIPAARGLFHKAIVQSGAGLERCAGLSKPSADGAPSAEAQGVAAAESLGLRDPDAAALRATAAERWVEGPEPSALAGFGPILDGEWLTADVGDAFAAGRQAPVPLLVGSNSLELPLNDQQFPGMLRATTRALGERDRERLRDFYPDARSFRQHVVSDVLFGAAARRQAALHARAGSPCYLYRFSVLSTSVRLLLAGAPHASERQYVFRTLASSIWPTGKNDEERAAEISAYWVAFAKTGDPGDAGLVPWPRYDEWSDALLEFTREGPRVVRTPDATTLDRIAELLA